MRSGKITKREVRKPMRKYVRRMAILRNNNGEQSSNSTGAGTIIVTSTEPIPLIASTTIIPSIMVAPSIVQEGMVFPLSNPESPSDS